MRSATLGTSLSESHAKTLKRYVKQAVICFDGDDAGRNASFKSANILRKAGVEVRVAYIPDLGLILTNILTDMEENILNRKFFNQLKHLLPLHWITIKKIIT